MLCPRFELVETNLKKNWTHLAEKKVLFHQANARMNTSSDIFSVLNSRDYFLFRPFGEMSFGSNNGVIAQANSYFEDLDKSF